MRLIAAVLLVIVTGAPAFAGEPSAACRDGAAACKDAFSKLEQCQASNADKPEACTAEKAGADTACRAGDSACDKDGSREPPARERPRHAQQ